MMDIELCGLGATVVIWYGSGVIWYGSTTKKYLGAYQRWRTWADARQGVPSFPVQGASSGAVRVAPQ